MALYNLILATKLSMGYDVSDTFSVLVPSFTFSGTVNAIVANHLTPVFCDIDESFTILPEAILDSDDTVKMVIPVSVYGKLPHIEQIGRFAKRKNLNVLYDNAPAFGSTQHGKFTHEFGYSEIFSFHATKPFTTMEGGCVVTSNPKIHKLLCELRDFGQFEKLRGDVKAPGLNSKMQEISAIIGLFNLSRWHELLTQRMSIIQQYDEFFNNLFESGKIRTMTRFEDELCTYIYYPILLNENVTQFVSYLNDHGITARRYYTAVHTLHYYQGKFPAMNLALTNQIKDQVVALPLHTSMSKKETGYLFETINNYFSLRKSL